MGEQKVNAEGEGESFNCDSSEEEKERRKGDIADTENDFLPSVESEPQEANFARVDRRELNWDKKKRCNAGMGLVESGRKEITFRNERGVVD